jgi:hypothetical protein
VQNMEPVVTKNKDAERDSDGVGLRKHACMLLVHCIK